MQIEAGKYYRTESGQIVGPMEQWDVEVEHPWQERGGNDRFCKGGDIWRDDGTSGYGIPPLVEVWNDAKRYAIEHDGFTGVKIGEYVTLEGKRGVVLQQDGTRVVHIYGEKWLKPA